MAEEIKDSSKTLPQAIVFGVAVNGLMGLIMVSTQCLVPDLFKSFADIILFRLSGYHDVLYAGRHDKYPGYPYRLPVHSGLRTSKWILMTPTNRML